jgi:hypothetical protein
MSKIIFHPQYESNREYWKHLIDAYEGGGGFRDGGYLFRHEKESEVKFRNRAAMAKYYNFAEIIVDTIRDSCLREKPGRAVEDNQLKMIFDDIDLRGRNWDTFVKDQMTLALIFGFVDTLVDVTNMDNSEIHSAYDEDINRVRPYLLSIHPLNLVNWGYDRDGLESVMIRETRAKSAYFEDDSADESKSVHYRFFDRDNWALFNSAGEKIKSGEHNLGAVPLIRLYCKRSVSDRFLGKSILPDPAVFIDYYNLDSEKREIFRQQTFSLLLITLGESSNRDDIQNLILAGTNNALALPYGAKAEFISPDPDQARLLIEEQQQIIRTIFRLKHLKYDTGSAREKSGEAFRWDYKDLHETLAGLAANIETFEYQTVRIISMWRKSSNMRDRFAVSYPTDFNIYSLAETLENAAKLSSLGLGEELNMLYAKKVVIPKLMSLSEKEKKKIFGD